MKQHNPKLDYLFFIVMVISLLFSLEAKVSGVPVDVKLEEVISHSQVILTVIKNQKEVESKDYLIKEILFNSQFQLKKQTSIKINGANETLFREIADAAKRGEPTPIPYLPTYNSETSKKIDFSKKFIVFLNSESSDSASAEKKWNFGLL